MALSDTLSTPTGGQKNGEKIKPKNGETFGTKAGIIFVPAFMHEYRVCTLFFSPQLEDGQRE